VTRFLAIAVGLTTLVACGSLFRYYHILNEQAQIILTASYELSDKNQQPTVADLQKHFGSQLQLDGCNSSSCTYSVFVSNRVLAALHVTPYTQMESYFVTRDGVVLANMVNYTTRVNHHHSVVSHVQIDFCNSCQAFAIHPWDASSSLDTNGIVEIGSEVPARNRRTVLSLNTRCLTKIGGCQNIADLLPTVWKQTSDKKIACIIQNDRGSVMRPVNEQ
jgi:hypothetical protein